MKSTVGKYCTANLRCIA